MLFYKTRGKCTSWLRRKSDYWKTEGRGAAFYLWINSFRVPVEQLEWAELSTYFSWCLMITFGWWILNLISGIKSPGEYNERCSFIVLGGSWKTRVFQYVPSTLVMTCGNKSMLTSLHALKLLMHSWDKMHFAILIKLCYFYFLSAFLMLYIFFLIVFQDKKKMVNFVTMQLCLSIVEAACVIFWTWLWKCSATHSVCFVQIVYLWDSFH